MIRCKFFKTCKGFTLIEVIIAIVMAALFGSMLFQFMNSSVISSSDEVVMVQQGYDLIGIMEQMIADYDEQVINAGTMTLEDFRISIEGNIPSYGTYTISTTYIKFDDLSGDEEGDTSGANNLLKVTITKGSQSLTSLFTEL